MLLTVKINNDDTTLSQDLVQCLNVTPEDLQMNTTIQVEVQYLTLEVEKR
jgi:hypothetical protein